ncbi:NAD(P)-dependent alcohol dehydrogenase [Novipirellula artificiosorum]|uniref:Quinone oxidoreductase 1 n=1 Tax=Novipirellula artificiosorum TaxID=2528016 RepID=A0A5C6DF79_9BACT|nr:NAD(P)-dependent alcohol dehydrogenase [Novipirellula artificiosorum]TWU35903.1 Quinone oxidoreductase 1 [Novipirellula artificiosorum]
MQPENPEVGANDTGIALPKPEEMPSCLPKTMRAVAYDRYGCADVLRLTETRTPLPKPGELILRVVAAGVNPIDYRLRRGDARYILPGGFPRIPGYDVAGTVLFAPSTCGVMPGDRVMAFLGDKYGGGYASYARCSANGVSKIPDSLSFEQAAAIPLAASTALQSLRDHGKIRSGTQVLINGASGGVGAFAVQIAKAYGAEVTAVSSAANESFVRSIGADHFIDYKQSTFTDSNQIWDLVFDVAGKSSYSKSRNVLSRGGRYVSTEPSVSGAIMSIATKLLSKKGTIMLARPCREDLRELVELIEAGKMSVTIDRLFPLQQAADAHRRIETGVDRGKIVIQVGQEPAP